MEKKDFDNYLSLVKDKGGFVLSFLPNSVELVENSLVGTALLPTYRRRRKRRSSNKDEFSFPVDDTIDSLDIAVQSDAATQDIKLMDSGNNAFSFLFFLSFVDKSHDEEHYKSQKQKEQPNFQLFFDKSVFIDTFQC